MSVTSAHAVMGTCFEQRFVDGHCFFVSFLKRYVFSNLHPCKVLVCFGVVDLRSVS